MGVIAPGMLDDCAVTRPLLMIGEVKTIGIHVRFSPTDMERKRQRSTEKQRERGSTGGIEGRDGGYE